MGYGLLARKERDCWALVTEAAVCYPSARLLVLNDHKARPPKGSGDFRGVCEKIWEGYSDWFFCTQRQWYQIMELELW